MNTRVVSCVLVASACLLGLAEEVLAVQKTAGPAVDFRDDYSLYPNGPVTTQSAWLTVWGSPCNAPPWGAPASIYPLPPGGPIGIYGSVVNVFGDTIDVGNNGDLGGMSTARYGAGVAYITYDDADFDPANAATTFVLTTIYGIDPSPGAPDLTAIAGYPAGTVIPDLSNETIFAPSGAVYTDPVGELATLETLASYLTADADLSIFTGDPEDLVWVFQTTVPLAELTIPEPATATLLAGLSLMGLAIRRR